MKNLMYRAYSELFLLREKGRKLLRDRDGVTMIEYSILLAIITAAVIVTIGLIGTKVSTAWTAINNAWT